MTVGRADANGTGSASASRHVEAKGTDQGKPVQPKPTSKPTGHGSAGGQNTTWSGPALQFARIDKALDALTTADAVQKTEHHSPASVSAYQKAQSRFSEAIEDEEVRGARQSPFSFEPRSADVRHRAEQLAKHYTGTKGEDLVRREIDDDQQNRIEAELDDVSVAAKHPSSSKAVREARIHEFNDILDDAADFVTRRRPGDGPSEEALKSCQFVRLYQFLRDLNQEHKNLDKGVLEKVVIRCATAMNISKEADLKTLERIVKPYNLDITNWINASRATQ